MRSMRAVVRKHLGKALACCMALMLFSLTSCMFIASRHIGYEFLWVALPIWFAVVGLGIFFIIDNWNWD